MEHLKINTPKEFMGNIEKIVKLKKVSYLEALEIYIANNNLEIETIGKFVKGIPKLKAKIYEEAKENRLVIDNENRLV